VKRFILLISALSIFPAPSFMPGCIIETGNACARIIADSGIVSVKQFSSRDSISVGERLKAGFEIEYPDSFKLHRFPALPQGKFEQISIKWTDEKIGSIEHAEVDLVLFTLDLEELYVPPVGILFTKGKSDSLIVSTGEIRVPVRLVSGGGKMLPLKSQWTAPGTWTSWLPAGLVLLALAAAVIIWRKRKGREKEIEPTRPKLPADFVALKELGALDNAGFLDAGEFKRYYTELTEIMRRYLEDRFDIDAMDRTTDEILDIIAAAGECVNRLEELLRESDLVKFAKFSPGIAAGKRAIESARRIVIDTTLVRESEASRSIGEG